MSEPYRYKVTYALAGASRPRAVPAHSLEDARELSSQLRRDGARNVLAFRTPVKASRVRWTPATLKDERPGSRSSQSVFALVGLKENL